MLRYRRWFLVSAFLLAGITDGLARTPHVLALHSFTPDPAQPSPFDQIMRPAIEEKLRQKVVVYTEYLELERFPGDEYRRMLVRNLRNLYRDRSIDVIVAIEFQALEFAQRYIGEALPDIPIVFVSVESSLVRGAVYAPNITGVVHKDDWEGALREILRIHPDTKEVVVFAGSGSIDHEDLERKKKLFRPFEGKVKFRYVTDLPLLDMLAITSKLPPKSVILQISFSTDSLGQMLPDDGAPKLLYQSANVPVYSLVGRNLGNGLIGGPVPAFQERYLAGADIVSRVLKGERPAAIPIQSAVPEHAMAFDWRQLKRWGIKEDRLPPGSLVSFREPTPWERYKWPVLLATLIFLAEGALIVGMMIQRLRRQRVENALRSSRNEVRDLAGKLIVAQEDERKRIARELHDDLSQQLAAIGMFVSAIRRDVASLMPKDYSKLEELQTHLISLHDEIHRLSHELHPTVLEHFGLGAALRQHANELSELTGMTVDVGIDSETETIPPDVALCLYRVAQESLRNVAKYSGTQRAEINLTHANGELELTIRDWGKGFDAQARAQTGGLGLTSMKERVRLVAGVLSIESAPQKGTCVRARVPLHPELPLTAKTTAGSVIQR
jgi:signal transduction histidine kinase